ncbi:MAG: 5-formyltetrahydrofolate cyclo-ligase [Lentimicrobium sp.]|nr:5-formyltetrahydrofolate cyclo-ligase [Lentimicrobium sp.]
MALRQQIKILKRNHKDDAYYAESTLIIRQLEELPEFKKAKTIMAYWSIKGEVYTHDFITRWCRQKRFVLPSVDGNIMHLKIFEGSDNLTPGDLYSIPEPDGPIFHDISDIDLIIVPGIAFDLNNNRMGRGKAYYDRFLGSTTAIKVGICFRFQLFNEVPCDENDIKMDMVISN